MMRNNHHQNGRPLQPPPMNVPILGQLPPTVWRCAQGHEATGGEPTLMLSVSGQMLGIPGVCVICVLEDLKARFPMTTDAPPPSPVQE